MTTKKAAVPDSTPTPDLSTVEAHLASLATDSPTTQKLLKLLVVEVKHLRAEIAALREEVAHPTPPAERRYDPVSFRERMFGPEP